MPFSALKYTRCVVIVHGKSELALTKYIYTNLHLPVKIISKDNGKSSIQINGLMDFLKKKFKSLSTFANEYSIEYDKKNKILKNFKLFTIMDTDDCEDDIMQKYISGEMFCGHPLSQYIVPIYNSSNLEDIMVKAGIMVKRISDAEKGTYYSKIFPINSAPMSIDTVDQVRTFAYKIKGIKETNMLEFVEYCFEQIPNERLWLEEDDNG